MTQNIRKGLERL